MGLDAGVITAAAASVLGILALLIIVVGIIALRLFGRAPMLVKLFVFILMFGSASALGDTIIHMKNLGCRSQANMPQDTASIAALRGNPSPLPGAHHV